MAIVGGFDVHRAQITFDYVDTETGEVTAGQIRPATRTELRSWLSRFDGRADVAFAVEGCTGWRFVVEELRRARIEPHLAEPADTATQRGRKKRAKTDRADARLMRDLLSQRRLPASWIPPAEVLEVRTLARLYVTLMAERRAWQQRIHAQLFHQGVPAARGLLTAEGQAALVRAELSPAGRQMVETALAAIDSLTALILPLRAQLRAVGAHQAGCRALTEQYGIGLLSGTIIWAELGDCRRFSDADQVVRFAGLDVTVWSSDSRRAPGHLARQGSPALRWALFEAAKNAAKSSAPEHAYYVAARDRLGGKRATLSVARKLARRCYHALCRLGDDWTAATPTDHPAAA
jgi:transposase